MWKDRTSSRGSYTSMEKRGNKHETGDHGCMSLMLRRAPSKAWLTPEMQAEMKKIEGCLNCRKCTTKCPYELNTPELLKKNYEDYKRVLAGEVSVL
jgi:Fe-S oxidoreductase